MMVFHTSDLLFSPGIPQETVRMVKFSKSGLAVLHEGIPYIRFILSGNRFRMVKSPKSDLKTL